MEYIVSARKYRPMSFDSVVGQQALTTTLKNTVKSGKLAHAYLFCGPRGVGKTTCARIFAKAINCLNPTEDGEACNECESCKAFNEQRSFNIFELDAASNNGVDQIKALMEQTRIPPQVGRYKVFIIDEVHMLSTQAFNAFLKTLEEPPAHVVFILATTEKHKILPTIISRCQIYDFERMTVANIVSHLKMVADKEGIAYEDEALNVIAEKADGGMRDALSVFDQTASFCQGNITYQKVIEDLNVLDSENYFNIIDFALENKVSEIMVLLNSVINKGFDGGHLISGLAAHVRNVMMAKDPQTLSLIECSERQREQYKQQAEKCSPQFLYSALRIMNQCDINYRQSTNKRLLVELTLIEIAQITQEEEPGVGRSPKQLKILFKKLNFDRQKQVVSQVATSVSIQHQAGTSQNSHQVGDKTNVDQSREEKKKTVASSGGRGKLRLDQILNTVDSLSRVNKKTAESQIVETEVNEKAIFTQDQLEFEWMSMCNRMPSNMTGMATRLKNIVPTIADFPDIQLTIGNPTLLKQVDEIKGRIRATMAKQLHNSDITFTLILAKKEEAIKALNKRDIFKQMLSDNKALSKLHEEMQFELI